MKSLALLACAALLASCSSPSLPSATVPAPTVAPLPEVVRPSTEAVAPLVRESSRDLTRARTENERLKDTVAEAHETNAALGSLLSSSIKDGQATMERLLEIEVLVNEEKRLNAALKDSTEVQAATIERLQLNAVNLEIELDTLTSAIAVANQRLTDDKAQLDAANARITEATAAHNAAVGNALEWKAEVDKAKGKIDTEKTWKWRFFWWAIGATVLVAGYVGLRLHPATRALIP